MASSPPTTRVHGSKTEDIFLCGFTWFLSGHGIWNMSPWGEHVTKNVSGKTLSDQRRDIHENTLSGWCCINRCTSRLRQSFIPNNHLKQTKTCITFINCITTCMLQYVLFYPHCASLCLSCFNPLYYLFYLYSMRFGG